MSTNSSVDFFETQFQLQIAKHDFALNPFERDALGYLRGQVLDFGCGMGNLAVAAARAGHRVVALDASEAAIAHLAKLAQDEGLALEVALADLRTTRLAEQFDTVVSIGLLMFFDCPTALAQLAHLKSLVRTDGVIVINVLTEGTTFLDMFSPEGHCLLGADDLAEHFSDWRILARQRSIYPAPGNTEKAFVTVIAQRLH